MTVVNLYCYLKFSGSHVIPKLIYIGLKKLFRSDWADIRIFKQTKVAIKRNMVIY